MTDETNREYEPGDRVFVNPPDAAAVGSGTVAKDEFIDNEYLYHVHLDERPDDSEPKRFRPWDLSPIED